MPIVTIHEVGRVAFPETPRFGRTSLTETLLQRFGTTKPCSEVEIVPDTGLWPECQLSCFLFEIVF